MDGAIFVNEYSRTKDTMREVYQYWYFRRPLSVMLYAVVAFNLLIRIVLLFTDGYTDPLMTFLILLIGGLYPAMYFIQVNAATKKDSQLLHGADMRACIHVTPDRFYPTPTDERVYIELSGVNYAFLTKNYIVLVMKTTRLMLIFHKDGFTTGDTDSFLAHLCEKGVRIKGQKK